VLKSSDPRCKPGSAGDLLRKAVISRLQMLCKHLVRGIASGRSESGAHPPHPPKACCFDRLLEQTWDRNHLQIIYSGKSYCTAQILRPFPSSPMTRDTSSLPRTRHRAKPSTSQRRLCRSLPTSHYSAEPRNVPKPRIIPSPWKKVWEDLLSGSPGTASKRANLGRFADLWAALARTLSLQTDSGYSGYRQLFTQRSCSHPFSARYLERCCFSKYTQGGRSSAELFMPSLLRP